MTGAAFKSEFPQKKPEMVSYRNYKHFDRNHFEEEIENNYYTDTLAQKFIENIENIKNMALEALNLCVFLKINYL